MSKENVKILLYTKDGCSYCDMAKELLEEKSEKKKIDEFIQDKLEKDPIIIKEEKNI